ncbi:hypothetical protein [Burkholderia sp. NRF60-BP8]|uniref:hypothetical protein n=1 Tax=Burkholderia sp. NRF60-BP8 TaxID=1637853 RepID=UPI000751AAED|nr:hypothetical protein [Burkholderia sp. NRF60-BP8]AOI80193.1 hypothetical protein WS54_24090 [Burkholderia sp. NRF60-BP8]KVA12301.1 hypothetical protein WS54_14975 [Burkholderia sp. NRF60-BP8]
MLKRDRLPYAALPSSLAALVPETVFLEAFEHAESQTVIVWYVDAQIGRQREIEFSPRLGRPLSRSEREVQFPPERQRILQDGIRVHIGNRLEADTDVRYETYTAYDPVTSSKLVVGEQMFFVRFLDDPEAVVRQAIERATFPNTYAGWSAIERTRYWVGVLYRARRQTGESGINEDEAFRPALLKQMRAVDPDVDGMLAAVLAELGRMEMVDPDDMRAAFNRRTGASV